MNTKEHWAAWTKMCRIMEGKRVISNEAEMDLMREIDDSFFNDVRSIPNPARVGLLDQYVVYQ